MAPPVTKTLTALSRILCAGENETGGLARSRAVGAVDLVDGEVRLVAQGAAIRPLPGDSVSE